MNSHRFKHQTLGSGNFLNLISLVCCDTLHKGRNHHRVFYTPEKIGKQLRKFYELADNLEQQGDAIENEQRKIVEYATAAREGTNNRGSRILRGKIVRDVINGNFAFGKKQD